MKIRRDFVTNSSSSSFVIGKANITAEQADLIRNHMSVGKKMMKDDPRVDLGWIEGIDTWSISESDFTISGWTSMDNFNMHEFLKIIGVDLSKVEWD